MADVGQHPTALDELNAVASLRATDPTSYYLAGQVLLSTGEPEAAKQKFERALQLSPDNQDIRSGLRRANELLEKNAGGKR